jgi:hypothetical protein
MNTITTTALIKKIQAEIEEKVAALDDEAPRDTVENVRTEIKGALEALHAINGTMRIGFLVVPAIQRLTARHNELTIRFKLDPAVGGAKVTRAIKATIGRIYKRRAGRC